MRPLLPSVPGNEGVARVLQIGKGVQTVKEGDRVVPLSAGLGTWRSHAVYRADQLLQVNIPLLEIQQLHAISSY